MQCIKELLLNKVVAQFRDIYARFRFPMTADRLVFDWVCWTPRDVDMDWYGMENTWKPDNFMVHPEHRMKALAK
jgi:hypothetical protein